MFLRHAEQLKNQDPYFEETIPSSEWNQGWAFSLSRAIMISQTGRVLLSSRQSPPVKSENSVIDFSRLGSRMRRILFNGSGELIR